MSFARFILGIPFSVAALVPVALGATAWRRRLFPGWMGLEAGLVDIVLGLAAVVVVPEALGTAGLFATVPVVVGLAATGTAMWMLARRRRVITEEVSLRARAERASLGVRGTLTPRWAITVAGAGLLLVAGSWLARTVEAIRHGMTTVDTLWYHLPVAARFVQSGHITAIHYLDQDPTTAFYPATTSLLHGLGLLFYGSDLVSTVVNLGWLALAFGAAWSLGRPFGVAPATTLGLALLLGTPGLVGTQPGGAYDDISGIACVLVAMAILVHERDTVRSWAPDAVAGLALGLALGMKDIFIIPVVAFCIGLIVISPRRARVRRAFVVLLGAALTGGYWYLRNALATGSPLPTVSIGLGPVSLPHVSGVNRTATVGQFLLDGRAWTDNFVPGFRGSLGPAWIAVLVFALVGMVAASVRATDVRVRMFGVVGVVGLVGFLLTPQSLVVAGRPALFNQQVRLSAAPLAIGLVVSAIPLRRWWEWIVGAYAIAVALTQLDPASWPTGVKWSAFYGRVSGAAAAEAVALLVGAMVLALVGARLRRAQPRLAARFPVSLVVPLVAVLALACVHGSYLDHRYKDTGSLSKVYAWPRDLHHARIAMIGLFMQDQYPMTGRALTNYVQYAGVRTSDGGYRPFVSCDEWARFLVSGRYDYVVIGPSRNVEAWTRKQPGVRLILTEHLGQGGSASVKVFGLDRALTRRSC